MVIFRLLVDNGKLEITGLNLSAISWLNQRVFHVNEI